ncbi:hypothetical protein [Streptomyces sp. NPDC014733]|uniref:hypothetical protein n=1 Tax=Streptomyces sp. NPDC014733 TaxID=3364885 RepID=UPI003701B688
MNSVHTLLRHLHADVTALAAAYRDVAQRRPDDAGTHYPARTVAGQCDRHAACLRAWAERFGAALPPPAAAPSAERGAADGHPPPPDRDLLDDLYLLHAKAHAAHLRWVVLGQIAQALREPELLAAATDCREETATQIGWLTTRVKEAAPQAVIVGDG